MTRPKFRVPLGVNEKVDESTWRRWREKPEYRPASLIGRPDRHSFDSR